MNFLAIDEGTTGVTVLLVSEDLKVLAEASQDFPQHFPQPGWVEHRPDEIWKSVRHCTLKVLQNNNPNTIAAIGMTNQRETLCFWDRNTGETLSPAIVWQDRRTSDLCSELKSRQLEGFFRERTGLLLDPYFSGTKLKWALQHWSPVSAAAKSGRLAVGTVDTFLLSRLTGEKVYRTEPSNASRTLLFDLHKKAWGADLAEALGISISLLPEVVPSTSLFGKTRGLDFLPDGIPITGILGDQQAALLGQACVAPGMAKCTYGTGAFILLNTGDQIPKSSHQLLTTVAWALDSTHYTYALEGSAFIAGAAVQWLRDGLGLIQNAAEIESLAKSVPNSGGVTFVPALSGLGAPHWKPEARGAFLGLSRGSTKAHLARAVLEGIALQISDILIAMQKDVSTAGGSPLRSVNVDGGAAANDLLMQFQADILNVTLKRPLNLETTSLGAIFAAGLGCGFWKDLNAIENSWKLDRTFEPDMESSDREYHLAQWNKSLEHV